MHIQVPHVVKCLRALDKTHNINKSQVNRQATRNQYATGLRIASGTIIYHLCNFHDGVSGS